MRWFRVGVVVLVWIALAMPAAGQQVVAGTVVDGRSQQPIAGAQIIVEGTRIGGLTDNQGRFRLTGVTGSEVTLRVIMLGYRSVTSTARVGATDVRMELEGTAIDIDAIVVTGTAGATQKRSLGNSLARIDASEVARVKPVTDIGQLLQGRAAGVGVSQQIGIAGGGARILIRGPGSLAFSGTPLVYVDGMRVNAAPSTGVSGGGAGRPVAISRLNDINPADIESVEIIKGPAAATLYGTEASAGVIQIITKKGREGDAKLSAQVRLGTSYFNDAAERVPMTYGVNPTTKQIDSINFLRRKDDPAYPLFRAGMLQGYSLGLTGGQQSIRYYGGMQYERDEGVVPTNDAERFGGRMKLSMTPSEEFDADLSLAFNKGHTTLYNANYFGSFLYGTPANLNPTMRGYLIAPAEVIGRVFSYAQDVDRYQSSLQLRHRPLPWLNQRLSVGLDVTNQRDQTYIPLLSKADAVYFSATFAQGQKAVERANTQLTTVDYGATASFNPMEFVKSNTSVGLQYYRTFVRNESVSGQQFPAPGVQTVSGAAVRTASENFVEDVTVGLYVQEEVAWRDRLFLTAAIRADDNSAFGSDFDLVTYPKLSASWVVSEEPFWNIGWINSLKVRGAYGESGQQPSSFAAIRTYAPVTGENDQPAGTPQAPGNPDLGPERGREIEIGFEGTLLGDRLGVDLSFYDQRTHDGILAQTPAPSTGYTGTQYVNVAEISNKGIEMLVRGSPYRSSALSADLTLNVAYNANELLSLGQGVTWLPVGWIPNRHQVGFPLDSYFRKEVVKADFDANHRAVNLMCDGGTGKQGLEPGGIAVPCAQAPYLYQGRPFHPWTGSFTADVTIRNDLQLSTLFDLKYGGQMFESVKYWNCSALRNHEITHFPQRFDPVVVAECTAGLDYIGTTRIQDNGYTKLREISATYTLPASWSARFGSERTTVSVAGRNLYTWTSYDGLDPEVFTPVNWLYSAHTELVLPLPRTFMITVNTTF